MPDVVASTVSYSLHNGFYAGLVQYDGQEVGGGHPALIERADYEACNRARIAGTGVTVQRVAGWYKLGLTPEEISDRIGHLNLAQVHAALAYYHANREQVEADLATEEAEDDEAERAYLARRQAA